MLKLKKYLLIILLLSISANFILGAKKKVAIKKGSPAPKIMLMNLKNKFFRVSTHFKKDVILINFWATYCKPCKKEIPELIKMSEEFKGKNLVMFFISIDKEGEKKVRPFIQENKFNIPETNILLDIYKVAANKYGVEKLPSLFIVNKRGTIEYSCFGFKEDNLVKVKSILAKLLK